MANDIAAVWAGLSAWCEANRPELLGGLNGPVSQDDRDALRDTDLPLTDTFLASLALHDGESDLTDVGLFASGGTLLPAARILEHRDMLRESLAELGEDDDENCPTLGPVRALSFNERWLPIMEMNGDVTWFLDFDPAPGGIEGQVIRVDPEFAEWVVCAPSFEAFLAAYLDDLRQGRIFDEDGELRDEEAWPPLQRLPALQAGVIGLTQLQDLGDAGRWDAVEQLMDRVSLTPAQRLRLAAQAAQFRDEPEEALRLLDELAALGDAEPDDVFLRVEVLEAQEVHADALALLDAAIASGATPKLRIRRAELVLAAAERAPVQGRKAQMQWLAGPAGQQVMATARERALADYDAALAQDDRIDWRLERIELLLDGERWEEAEAASAALLERLNADESEEAQGQRERAEDALERAQRRGEGESDEVMGSLDELLFNLGEMFGDKDAGALDELREVRDTFAQLREKESQERAVLDAEPDSLRRRARDVAQQLARQHVDTTERYAPFDPAELDATARRYYDQTRDALLALGFTFCADVEPLRNTETNGNRVLLRVLLSADRRTAAAVWRLANAFATYEVIELESELGDGRIAISNNSGSANPFQQPEGIEVLALPLGTTAERVWVAHRKRLDAATRPIADLDAVLALQERQRRIKREAARARGWVTDAELRGLLGASYRELQGAVREELESLL